MQGILIALSPSHWQNAWHRLFHFLAVSGSFDFVASALCAGATPLRMTGLNWGCPSRTPARHGWGSLCRVRVRLGPPPGSVTLRVRGVSFWVESCGYNLAVMDAGIKERVEALRREIAEIQKLSQAYLQMPRPDFSAMNDHARRSQRLTEIMDELRSMTEWKKT